MNNDWETRWLPPLTLGIIRVTSLWLDQRNLFDIIAGSTLGVMGCLPAGESRAFHMGRMRQSEPPASCKPIRYPYCCFMNTSLEEHRLKIPHSQVAWPLFNNNTQYLGLTPGPMTCLTVSWVQTGWGRRTAVESRDQSGVLWEEASPYVTEMIYRRTCCKPQAPPGHSLHTTCRPIGRDCIYSLSSSPLPQLCSSTPPSPLLFTAVSYAHALNVSLIC